MGFSLLHEYDAGSELGFGEKTIGLEDALIPYGGNFGF